MQYKWGQAEKSFNIVMVRTCTYHAHACFLYSIETFFIRFIFNPLGSHNSLQDFICFPHVTVISLSLVSSSNLKQCPRLPQLPYCMHSVQLMTMWACLRPDALSCYLYVSCSCFLQYVIDLHLFYWQTYCCDDDMDVLVLRVWFEVKPVTPLSFSWSPCVALLLQLKHVVCLVINHGSIETNFFKSSGCFMFELLTFVNFVLLAFSYKQMHATFKPFPKEFT